MRRTLIIILTLITAGIHLYFFTTGSGFLFTMFLLNALGYLGLLGLLYLPLRLPEGLHKMVRLVFIGYNPDHRVVHHYWGNFRYLVGTIGTDRKPI
jgi:hypothetical protein